MARIKFCFHEGAGGQGYPKELLRELNENGIPFGAKATDKMPYDAQEIARAFPSIENFVIYRRSVQTAETGTCPSGNPDVPQYHLHPREAAVNHWNWHRKNLPIELDSEITWIETINEVAQEFVFGPDEEDKAREIPLFNLRSIYQRQADGRWVVTNGEWMAEFAKETAVLTLRDGYKWLAFGWGPGEPETAVWHGQHMVEFLYMCANFPDRLGIALHEYSKTTSDIWAGDGWLVGRFLKLYGACEDNELPYPTTAITEWGWTLWNVPDWDKAKEDYLSVGELYAQYPTIKTAAIWALNAGWQGIAEKAAKHIRPLHELTMTTNFPDPVDPPVDPPVGETWEQRAWAVSVEEQISRGIPLNPTAGLQKAIFETTDGRWTPVHRERTLEGKTIQAAEELTGKYPRRVYVWQAGKPVWWFYEPDTEPPIPPGTIDAPTYWQRDPRWADHPCGFGPKTIAQWGCLLCAYNALAEYWDISEGRVPYGENEYYKAKGGFSGSDLVSMAMSKVYSQVKNEGWLTRDNPLMNTRTRDYLSRGIPVPARVDFNPGTPNWEQHWVLLVGYDAARGYLMNDPWTGKTAVYVSDYYGIAGDDVLECIYYYLDNTPPVEPPPAGRTVDLKPYFQPAGDRGDYVVFHFPDGKTQPQQLQKLADGRTILWKGEGQWFDNKKYFDYEEYKVEDGKIKKGTDTSDAGNGGRDAYSLGWATWLPQVVEVRKLYISSPVVYRFDRTTCKAISTKATTDYIYVREVIPLWASPANQTITYQDVVVVEWRKTANISTPAEETYYLAKGVVYCAWGNAYIGERPGGRAPIPGQLTDCL